MANYSYLDPTVTKDKPRTDAAGNITTPSNEGRKLVGTAKHNSNA